MSEQVFVSLPSEDWDHIIYCMDYTLHTMDQEYHFFQEEPGSMYYQLIEIRDYIISLTKE